MISCREADLQGLLPEGVGARIGNRPGYTVYYVAQQWRFPDCRLYQSCSRIPTELSIIEDHSALRGAISRVSLKFMSSNTENIHASNADSVFLGYRCLILHVNLS